MIPVEHLKIEAIDEHRGGQHVLRHLPVRVTHIPTGIMAQVLCRSQHRAKQVAIRMIEEALTDSEFQ
jgi:protein subunit release factor A